MIFNQQTAPQVLNALTTNIQTIFNNAFDAAPSQWNLVAMEVPSNGKSNTYAWIEKFPKLRKWFGDKVIKQLSAHAYTVQNNDFEATIAIDRNDIEDDNLGIYLPQAQMAGESSKQWADELVFTALTQGFKQTCYDEKTFYATNHETSNGKSKKLVSNKLDIKLDASSLEGARKSYGAARTMMKSMKDNEGRSLNLNPNVLVVPPALEDDANALMTVERFEDGRPNIYKGTATVVVSGDLETDTEWHLLDASKAIKPIIFQPRKKPVFVALTDLSNEAVFMRKEFKFGAEARGAAGYGLWQMAVGSTGEK